MNSHEWRLERGAISFWYLNARRNLHKPGADYWEIPDSVNDKVPLLFTGIYSKGKRGLSSVMCDNKARLYCREMKEHNVYPESDIAVQIRDQILRISCADSWRRI